MGMSMRTARERYRKLYSQRIDTSKTEERRLERVWNHDRPSFRAWARDHLNGVDISSPKLRHIRDGAK